MDVPLLLHLSAIIAVIAWQAKWQAFFNYSPKLFFPH
jgi:hypothetical protein